MASTSPAAEVKASSAAPEGTPTVKREASIASVKPVVVEEQSTEYNPLHKPLTFFGGHNIEALRLITEELSHSIPDVPRVEEMGVIDLRALMLGLQCGIHAEVRLALDHLVRLSVHPGVIIDLDKCEDLTDVLIDCAEEQIDILAEEAPEVSDLVDLPSYEDVVRSCRVESESLQDVAPVGTNAYEMERAAERLIAITTILRNFSFNEGNHRLLSTKIVINFLSNAIRLLGTRNTFLRTSDNVAALYKDIITFLSNVTGIMELPTRDDALHILHFLLAFAPQPAPSLIPDAPLRFVSYNAPSHRYLPLAVDSLAKLLARQEPNRSLYRQIFTSSPSPSPGTSSESTDLLTRAFALSISILPDRTKGSLSTSTEIRTVEARKALLTQGMLAADILASLAPGPEAGVAKAWLESEDRWPSSLLRMAYVLSTDRATPAVQQQRAAAMGGRMPPMEADVAGYALITHRGLGMLKRLVEKAGRKGVLVDGGEEEVLRRDPMPQRETVLGALLTPSADKGALRLLCGLYGMVA